MRQIAGPDGGLAIAKAEIDVDLVEPLGLETLVYFTLGSDTLCARVDPDYSPSPGARMPVSIDLERLHLFDAQTGKSLRRPLA